MSEIIDFEILRKQRFVEKQCFLRNRDKIDELVEAQQVTIKENAALLNILKVLDDKKIVPKAIFQDVFELKKSEFEQVYKLNWWTMVEYCLIFLKILKDHNEEDYQQFFEYE